MAIKYAYDPDKEIFLKCVAFCCMWFAIKPVGVLIKTRLENRKLSHKCHPWYNAADYNSITNSKAQINDQMLFSESVRDESKNNSSFEIGGNLPNSKWLKKVKFRMFPKGKHHHGVIKGNLEKQRRKK